MNFIKKIFENKIDETVRKQFMRFGKGKYEHRALIEIKIGKNVSIKTSYEFCNDLVRSVAQFSKKSKIKISGLIVSAKEIANRLEKFNISFDTKKWGVQYKAEILESEISPDDLLKLHEEFKFDYLLLKLKSNECSLACKTSLPKPGKELKANFCVAGFLDNAIVEDYGFGVNDNAKEMKIEHTFIIEKIEIPKEYENDFEKARLYAKRYGKIIRKISFDGKAALLEKEFCI